ncbi:hypothetical protein L1049_025026 [Liquidambar formosana]|uniref:Uncharacterized protein n=1 Tax=Liquidambar formosana TaxID=63359 RepID=A0AAP0RVM6_LIQFO
MDTMDLKGITWVGNIYQKFESICLEVEEIMYQDTVEYVENQVQTVGASVKRFCADVMQELLPPSSMDPVKEVSDLPLELYADVGIYIKPKVYIKEEPIKVEIEQLKENSNVIVNVDKHAGHASSISGLRRVNRLLPPSSGDSVKEACSDVYLGQKNSGAIYRKSNVGIIRKPKKENRPPSEISEVINSVAKDLSKTSSFCELPNENNEAACDQIAMISHPVSDAVMGCDLEKEKEGGRIRCDIADVAKCLADTSINLPSSDRILLVASIQNKEMELKSTSSSAGLSPESNDMSINNGVVSLIRCSAKGDTQNSDSADMEEFMSHNGRSDDWNIDAIESNDFTEPGMEATELIDKEKLEETCVMVDGGKLCSIPHREGKHKSYKKKIRDALSSKMRSSRKQEYEQLAAQYEDINTGPNQECVKNLKPILTMDSETEKLQTHDFCESEWELL